MHVIRTIAELRETVASARNDGKSIALVPTMGYLHDGHMSLVRLIQGESSFVVVSIFVNPTQFGEGEDLEAYPRDFEADRARCEAEGIDVIFCPDVDEMYPSGSSVIVDETKLAQGLCGASRPGHFSGVLTVVAKLFNIVQPDRAVFGQKDAQQARLIMKMVDDLDIPVEILVAPIVREDDGLAMSSRNSYLSNDERKRALCLSSALRLAEKMVKAGERDADVLRERMAGLIAADSGDVDYIEIVEYSSLQPVQKLSGEILIALAVRIGSTRLIDNTVLTCA